MYTCTVYINTVHFKIINVESFVAIFCRFFFLTILSEFWSKMAVVVPICMAVEVWSKSV